MAKRNPSKKVANRVVAVSSAAVLAVYAAGYTKTQTAADRLEAQSAVRRPAAPVPARAAPVAPVAEAAPVIVAKAEPAAPVKAEPQKAKTVETPAATTAAPETAPPPPPVAETKVEPPPAPVAPPPPPAPVWKDGRYSGWGTSRHGDIEATVVIEGGKIASAHISQCLTRYSCDVIDKLIPQVAQRQSPDVDTVGGATQSADAFYYAVREALSKAK